MFAELDEVIVNLSMKLEDAGVEAKFEISFDGFDEDGAPEVSLYFSDVQACVLGTPDCDCEGCQGQATILTWTGQPFLCEDCQAEDEG